MFAVLCLLLVAGTSHAQDQSFSWKATYGKSPTQFTPAEWAPIIDATWGDGLDTARKVFLFDVWWNDLNLKFGGHHGIDIDLQAMKARYRPEIQAGVSKGRFSGIMTHFTYQLQELHTYLFDTAVRNTPLAPGVPMMVVGHYGSNQHFGALLAALPDSTLLVYEALPDHPLDLVPGDVVLGYDGVLWKDIYPQLLEAELPLFLNPVHANTDEGNYHYLMQAAGLNWHLFDTIDVIKYATGDTLHFPTASLAGQTTPIWGKDQIAPPGVPWPDRSAGERVSWGLIDGTNIGFVTVTSWSLNAQVDIRAQFAQAVDELMHTHQADGIIFDFRYNTGGNALARDGLALLFNEDVPTVGFDRRVIGTDPFAMEPDPSRREVNLVIRGDPATYYDNPIAILVGPGSISAGELEARRMSFHPRARIFGLPAPAGNTGSDFISINDSNWFVSRANSTQYLVSTHEYLTHTPLTPHVRTWFEKEDVVRGVDTVIEAAKNWILAETTSVEDGVVPPTPAQLEVFPNPGGPKRTLSVPLTNSGHVDVRVYDLLGREIARPFHGFLSAGTHQLAWDGRSLDGGQVPAGAYVWRVETDTGVQSTMSVHLR